MTLSASASAAAVYRAAVRSAQDAAAAYYDGTDELLTDAEYDALLVDIESFEAANPESAMVHDLFVSVAGGMSGGGDLVHTTPMLSLDKANTFDEVRAFLARAAAAGGTVVMQPKMDGMAVNTKYVNGALESVAIRGDGQSGEDITDRILALSVAHLPRTIAEPGVVEVRGELIMTSKDFAVSNAARIASGQKGFVNSRNAVAGVARKSENGYRVNVTFVAYDVVGADDLPAGFRDVQDCFPFPITSAGTLDNVEAFEAARKEPDYRYPTDGAVLKVVEPAVRALMGATSRAPRWAVAYKYPPVTARTVVLGIDVAVGRTGNISYTAILQPVFFAGSTVGRATLHNPDFIALKGVRIGREVEIAKMNDIIPGILRSIPSDTDDAVEYVPSTLCPVSGTTLDTSGAIWRSNAPEASLGSSIAYAASRDAFDIDGLGGEIAAGLVDADLVTSVADLFTLTSWQLAEVQLSKGRLLGLKTATKLVANIEAAKAQPFNRVITALGIRKSGRTFGRRLAAHFGTMDAILEASEADFFNVDGVGDERAALFFAGFHKLFSVIEQMDAAGVNMGAPLVAADPSVHLPLTGDEGQKLRVCVTGAMTGELAGLSRTGMSDLIVANGGEPVSSVSKTTDILVCGETGSSKWVAATKLSKTILTPAKFADLLAGRK